MTSRHASVLCLIAVLAMTTTACGVVPGNLLNPGARVWVIPVQNGSGQPAVLAVAKDESPMGDLVGAAQPAVVPAGQTIDVTFTVPADRQGWAIFVNPGPNHGPLITAPDVPPEVSGRLPLSIFIGPNGEPSVTVPAQRGWFGN